MFPTMSPTLDELPCNNSVTGQQLCSSSHNFIPKGTEDRMTVCEGKKGDKIGQFMRSL